MQKSPNRGGKKKKTGRGKRKGIKNKQTGPKRGQVRADISHTKEGDESGD